MPRTRVKAHTRSTPIYAGDKLIGYFDIAAITKQKQPKTKAKLKTIGKYKVKPYECTRCGYRTMTGTNHWGEYYDKCPNCSWKNPNDPIVTWRCLEPTPQGYTTPPKWKKVKLGDVAEIVQL